MGGEREAANKLSLSTILPLLAFLAIPSVPFTGLLHPPAILTLSRRHPHACSLSPGGGCALLSQHPDLTSTAAPTAATSPPKHITSPTVQACSGQSFETPQNLHLHINPGPMHQ